MWREAIFFSPTVLLPGRDSKRLHLYWEKKKTEREEESFSSLAFSLSPSLPLYTRLWKWVGTSDPTAFIAYSGGAGDDTHWILINKKRETVCVCEGGHYKTQHTLAEESLSPPPPPSSPLWWEEKRETENSPPKLKQRHCRLNTRSNLLFILSKE